MLKKGIVIGLFLALLPLIALAKTYLAPDGTKPYTIGSCTLVNTRSEADSTHVYTLNPTYVDTVNSYYRNYLERYAKCNELQFHVDHSTPLPRLQTWLASVYKGWYTNMGTSPYNNNTVSTPRHEWYFIQNGIAHRIPDVLTAWSWGLMIDDRKSAYNTQYFYTLINYGAPLNFNNGPYADIIRSMWKDGSTDTSQLPTKLATQINTYLNTPGRTYTEPSIFKRCYFDITSGTSLTMVNLLDFKWMQNNPGCN